MSGKDYLIMLGAPKCATSSLARWLNQLPGAVLARGKETRYFTDFPERHWEGPGEGFANKAVRSTNAFLGLFDHAPEADLRIEASTDNLSCPRAIESIQRFSRRPDVRRLRLVAVTRDPVDRIVSEFEHTLRVGWQGPDLLRSLQLEQDRIKRGWHPLFRHIFRTRYATQIAAYREAFGKNLLILDYHTLKRPETLARLAAFAGREAPGTVSSLGHSNARKVFARPRATAILRNKTLRGMASALVPQSLRPGIRSLIRGPEVERYRPTEAERTFILDALRDEIDACIADAEISTEHWSCLSQRQVCL